MAIEQWLFDVATHNENIAPIGDNNGNPMGLVQIDGKPAIVDSTTGRVSYDTSQLQSHQLLKREAL